jgi:hypothetical protein
MRALIPIIRIEPINPIQFHYQNTSNTGGALFFCWSRWPDCCYCLFNQAVLIKPHLYVVIKAKRELMARNPGNKIRGLLIFWSRWPDLNRRPADYESAALPLSHIGLLSLAVRTKLLAPINYKGLTDGNQVFYP